MSPTSPSGGCSIAKAMARAFASGRDPDLAHALLDAGLDLDVRHRIGEAGSNETRRHALLISTSSLPKRSGVTRTSLSRSSRRHSHREMDRLACRPPPRSFAAALGYSSASAFGGAFKRTFDTHPSDSGRESGRHETVWRLSTKPGAPPFGSRRRVNSIRLRVEMQLSEGGWVVLVMGVSGSGKTTIGRRLAAATGARFVDADDYHTPENLRKMSLGTALTDADRAPWLEALRGRVQRALREHEHVVLACSALKQTYRDTLRIEPARVPVVFLEGSAEMIAGRLRGRRGHFAPAALLDSQLETLEKPHDAIAIDVAAPPDEVIGTILGRLGLASPRLR
jgi:gluconokinase